MEIPPTPNLLYSRKEDRMETCFPPFKGYRHIIYHFPLPYNLNKAQMIPISLPPALHTAGEYMKYQPAKGHRGGLRPRTVSHLVLHCMWTHCAADISLLAPSFPTRGPVFSDLTPWFSVALTMASMVFPLLLRVFSVSCLAACSDHRRESVLLPPYKSTDYKSKVKWPLNFPSMTCWSQTT